ncbi:MAG: hypothetical protein ACI8YQ_003350 [Polaribacter sp.]|jgi:hypothetical protein
MIELIHKTLLWIHIPFGFLSLVLFWIPVGLKKGSPLHKKVGWYYYGAMWIVLITSFFMSICNLLMAKYMMAMYLGYLAIITAYPLWYSYEILQQQKEWTARYYTIRKVFLGILFSTGIGMILLGAIKFQFQGMGTMMVFFGLLVMPAGRAIFFSKEKAMDKEAKLKMHIQGTIISGIAAYTAFFAFGGARILMGVFELHPQWIIVPWLLPSVLGIAYSRYMKRKYKVA